MTGRIAGCDACREGSDDWVQNRVDWHVGGAWPAVTRVVGCRTVGFETGVYYHGDGATRSAGDGLAVAKSCGLAQGAGMHGVENSEERDLFGSGAGLRQFGGGF